MAAQHLADRERLGPALCGYNVIMAVVDPSEVAADAGLVYLVGDRPGITRRRHGRGVVYEGPRGGRIDASTRGWIESLAIPPAWGDVWISPDREAHLLAHGVDAAGRTQYRYHPEFRRAADATKFARMSKIADRLPRLRAATRIALRSADERICIIGLVTHLIDCTLIRVGTERYAEENDSYGACTLLQRHVRIDAETVAFDFRSKGGLRRRFSVSDQLLAEQLSARRRPRPSSPILVTSTGWTPSGADLADFLSSATGIDMTAKDLRTWGATSTMVGALCAPTQARDPLLAAYDVVAARLGNTRNVTRASYVAPRIVDAWESGELGQIWSTSRASARFSRAERAAAKALRQS